MLLVHILLATCQTLLQTVTLCYLMVRFKHQADDYIPYIELIYFRVVEIQSLEVDDNYKAEMVWKQIVSVLILFYF